MIGQDLAGCFEWGVLEIEGMVSLVLSWVIIKLCQRCEVKRKLVGLPGLSKLTLSVLQDPFPGTHIPLLP